MKPRDLKVQIIQIWTCGEETVISQLEKELQRQDISNAEKQILHLDVFTNFNLAVPSVWPEFLLSGRVRFIYFSLTASWTEWDRAFFVLNFLLIAKLKMPCQTVGGSLYLFSHQSYNYHYYSLLLILTFCMFQSNENRDFRSLGSMQFFTPISNLSVPSNLQPDIQN